MTQATTNPTAAPRPDPRLARAGFERPVEHLHFDRRARVWWSHGEAHGRSGRIVLAAPDGVSE